MQHLHFWFIKLIMAWAEKHFQEIVFYYQTENALLLEQLGGKPKLNDTQRAKLARAAHSVGRKKLKELKTVFAPETMLGWYQRLIVKKWTYPNKSRKVGRPRKHQELEQCVIRMTTENRWGCLRIANECKALGFTICKETVRRIQREAGLDPAPERTTTWKAFLKSHCAIWGATFLHKKCSTPLDWSHFTCCFSLTSIRKK